MNDTLFKGVFWVISDKVVSSKMPCDEWGNILENEDNAIQVKEWSNNHKNIWSGLPRTVTKGNSYNYYPRGRVEIRNRKTIIFLNPSLCSEKIIRNIKTEFNLANNTLLREILIKADGSWHYRYYYAE